MRFVSIFFLVVAAFFLSSCDVFNTTFDDMEKAEFYEANDLSSVPEDIEELNIMSWNIKFGGGRIDFFFDGWGDEVLMSEEDVIGNMQGIADYINLVQPDIILLQEVDIDSKRDAYVDQVQYLLDNTDLNYGVYASQWKADIVPSDGIGRVNSGNAILSRWEFTSAERIALPLIGEQDELTQYFYLRRNILSATISIQNNEFAVLNTHTAAYSSDGTKKDQIDILKEEMDKIAASGKIFIGGGDLNAIPPDSPNFLGDAFPDRPTDLDDDFEVEDYDITELEDLYASYIPALPLYDDGINPYFYHQFEEEGDFFSPFYTHTIKINLEATAEIPLILDWNRKLDYLFTNNSSGWKVGSFQTHQDTRSLSDHCPISVKLEL